MRINEIPRPLDGRKAGMTTPPVAWPDADEDDYQERADLLARTVSELRPALDTWTQTRTRIFDGRTWDGRASIAANIKVRSHIECMQTTENVLERGTLFYHNTSISIANAKQDIIANCNIKQAEINELKRNDYDSDRAFSDEIQRIVDEALETNKGIGMRRR